MSVCVSFIRRRDPCLYVRVGLCASGAITDFYLSLKNFLTSAYCVRFVLMQGEKIFSLVTSTSTSGKTGG